MIAAYVFGVSLTLALILVYLASRLRTLLHICDSESKMLISVMDGVGFVLTEHGHLICSYASFKLLPIASRVDFLIVIVCVRVLHASL